MDSASNATSIWRNWKFIAVVLSLFFLVAVIADVVLWYSLQKTDTAAETLNDIVARQPLVPKTPEEKVKLLDAIITAQTEANTARSGKTAAGAADTTTPHPATQTEINAKIKLLDSLRKSP